MKNDMMVFSVLLLAVLIFVPSVPTFQNDSTQEAHGYFSDDEGLLTNEHGEETVTQTNATPNPADITDEEYEVNVGGGRSSRKFLDALRLNFDPWNPEDGETVVCSATVHNFGAEGQVAQNVNVDFYFGDECIGTGTIYEIEPGDNGTAQVDWKAVHGNHTMKIVADPDGSDGGPDEFEVSLNVTRPTYSPRLLLPNNASWIRNTDTNNYFIKVINTGTSTDTIDLSFRTKKYGNDPGGWSIALNKDEVSLDGGESTYVKLSVEYMILSPDYTAEAVVTVTAQSQNDNSKESSIRATTSVIHDTPILFVDDDGQHKYRGEDDPMLPGHFTLNDGAWGGSYGAESDYVMNYSLDVNYEGMWDYVNLPGDQKDGRWVNSNTMGGSGPVFNSQTIGYNPVTYPYEDESGNDIFLENYDVVIWNLGYSETLTSDPGGDDEPKSNNDLWWDQNETAKYLRDGGNLWLTGNAISFYFDRYAPIEGKVTNQWLRDYYHVDACAHAAGLKPQIVGVAVDPIGKGITTMNGHFYGNTVVGGERGNVATDWAPMEDAHGVIYGKGKHYSTVRYEHPRESSSNQRFKTVLQSGGFENFGDWNVLDEPMRIKLVERVLTWLGVPSKNAPEYDVGVLKLNQPVEDYIEPENTIPIHVTLGNCGQKDITDPFQVKFKVAEVGGSLLFQRTEMVNDDIPVGDILDVWTTWSSNRPQEGTDYRITVTLENPSFTDGDAGNNEVSVIKTAHSIVDIGIGMIWHDWEAPWNAAIIGYDTIFHAKVHNHGSTEMSFDVEAVIWSPLGTIVYEETTPVTLFPGYSTTLDWTWTPRNPGGLISGYGGSDGDVSDPYILNISVSLPADNVSGNDGRDFEVVVMAFYDGSEQRFMVEDWTPVDLSDHNNHGNEDEMTPWHLTNEWYMSESNAWKASNSQGQLRSDWNTCLISPKISLKNFTDARINNMHSGQLGGSCSLELSMDYDGNPNNVEGASWTQIWSKSYQAQAVWMVWNPISLNEYIEEEFYLRYRLTTTEDNDVGWYADDLVITGVVKNYTTNDIGVRMVSIHPLIDEKEIPRIINVTVQNFGENTTNTGERPAFDVRVTIEDEDSNEVYNMNIRVNEVLGIGDTCIVSFNSGNGKDWVPEENGRYRIYARTIWEKDLQNIDDNPHNDVKEIDGIVEDSFFSDDMESGENEWTTEGQSDGWALGTPTKGPTPHSGSNCWGTNLDGNYPDLNDKSIVLEHAVDLRTTADPVLSVWHWLELEADDYDTAYVEVRATDQSKFTPLWSNPTPPKQGVPFRTDGWEMITLDLDDFAYHEVFIRFRLETDGDVNYLGWYIDDVSFMGSTPPSHDAMVLSIDYPADSEFIAPSETIEILATVMNVGLNQEVIPVKCKAIRQGSSPVTYDLGEQFTGVLDPGDKEQVKFNWQLPIGTYQYKIEIETELKEDPNPDNDMIERYIWAKAVFDISILSIYADPMVQDVARTRQVVAEVQNIGNTELTNNVQITFEAMFEGDKVDEHTTVVYLTWDEISPVSWEWQSFKYGSYEINVIGSIVDEIDVTPANNEATLGGIITAETIFSDTREEGDTPYYLNHDTGEFGIWDRTEMGELFWTGDNESDPEEAGWHVDDIGHFSRRSWYGGILDDGRYDNNMEASLISQALNLEHYSNVTLSFYTTYVLEGREYDYVEISISTDVDDDDSWERLLRFPEENASHDSSREPGNHFGWLHKDVFIPGAYLHSTFYMRIMLKTDNVITYSGVWIDDMLLYGTDSENPAPVPRFSATHDLGDNSYSRHVIQNPPVDFQQIKGNYAFNNLPQPVGGEQGGIQLNTEIHFNADLSFDPDAGDDTLTYKWFFGDGTTMDGKTVTYAYTGDLPLEGYFRVTLRVTDEHDAFSEDTMLIWIGNMAPDADFIVTSAFDTSTPISDENDGVVNGFIDVFYGDRITFLERSTDEENDFLTFQWEFQCKSTKYTIEIVGDTVSGVVGEDFLYEGLDGFDPIIPVTVLDYTVTLLVSDGVSISEMSYTIRVHPYAVADFDKQVKMGSSLLEATVTLTWRGFPEEAAPHPSFISLSRPVFVYIDETAISPDPLLGEKGGIGAVYGISSVGCKLQNGDEGFIEAVISLPILVTDIITIGDSFVLQEDLRLEYFNEMEERFTVVEGSYVNAQGGMKYVVGTVDHFSIFTVIVDSVYNESNVNYESRLPDLSVYNLDLSRSPVLHGQETGIHARIRNVGITHARNVGVNFYDGEDLIGEETISVVNASGEWVDVKATFTVIMFDPKISFENHIIRVFVNELLDINESPQKFTNNVKQELLVAVSTMNQPPTPKITTPAYGATVNGNVLIKGRIPDDDTDVGIVYQPFGNNDFAWHIESVDPNPVSVYSVSYNLVNQFGDEVSGGQGRVKDIYGLNYGDFPTNISYFDNDRDGRISAGDVFLVRNVQNGGLAEEGYSLELEFGIVDKVQISINGGEWNTVTGTDSWSYEWNAEKAGDGEHVIKARSSDGQDYSEEVRITVVVGNTSDDPELVVYLILISMLGILSLILISLIVATFDVKL